MEKQVDVLFRTVNGNGRIVQLDNRIVAEVPDERGRWKRANRRQTVRIMTYALMVATIVPGQKVLAWCGSSWETGTYNGRKCGEFSVLIDGRTGPFAETLTLHIKPLPGARVNLDAIPSGVTRGYQTAST